MIHQLDRKIFRGDDPYGVPKDSYWWLVYDRRKKEYIAFAGIHIRDKSVFLCRAGVIKKYRGKGLHRFLIEKRLKYCRRWGLQPIKTYVHKNNLGSLNNLIRYGFKITSITDEWVRLKC